MATIKRVMANTSEIDLGVTYSMEFPVDDNATTTGGDAGIEWASLIAVKGDGTSAYFYDDNSGTGQTVIKADADDETKEAVGILITTSDKSAYDGLDLTNQLIMKPFGTDHENMTTPPCRKVRLNVYDNTLGKDTAIYNNSTVALTGTVEVAGGALGTVTGTLTAFDTELAEGDLISVGGEIREIDAVNSATEVTVSEDFSGATAGGATAYQWTDYNRPVYLSTTAGDFTKIKPVTSGDFKQEVGRIVSGNHVEIDIKKGSTVA